MVLGFDTSGAHCGAALFHDGDVISAMYENMVRGQAERLVPMLEEVLQDAAMTWDKLDAIGVGVGPGNFTGIRISVATARGLSLSLEKPAIGVSIFDALAEEAKRPALLILSAPRDQVYATRLTEAGMDEPAIFDLDDLPEVPDGTALIGQNSQVLAPHLSLTAVPSVYAPASAIARIAARRLGEDHDPPKPIYMRPADAAPPRDPPPRIKA